MLRALPLLLLAIVACDDAPADPAPVEAPAAETTAAIEQPDPDVEVEPPEPALDEEAEAELEDLTETLRAASTAAETYETGSTLCEAAHASLLAMMEAVAERYPDQVRQAPPKGAFMQACERLPEEAQECLLPTHAMAHVEDCAAITDALDAEQRASLERVLGGA